jgi:N-acetylglutamate synthase-like GNAT family acetyltransferase
VNELFTRYPDSSSHFLDPATEFLVAIDDGDTVGCIGLMPIVAGVGEIKRMFVRQDQRGRGIARFLILELEQYALRQGAELLRLATGERQPEAIALYESLGYQAAERYGKYVTDPVSRCYTKNLTPSPPEAELTTPSSVSCSPACRASSVLDASASPGSPLGLSGEWWIHRTLYRQGSSDQRVRGPREDLAPTFEIPATRDQ